MYLLSSKKDERFFQIVVALSEYMNFNCLAQPKNQNSSIKTNISISKKAITTYQHKYE